MTFRADEEIEKGYERALNYLVPKQGDSEQKEVARKKVIEIIKKYGPVIELYPTWHPIVSCFPRNRFNYAHNNPNHIENFRGLGHTILLTHGFISCPYQGADELIEKINNTYKTNHENVFKIEQISNVRIRNILWDIIDKADYITSIVAERIDVSLHDIKTETIFVKCEWHKSLDGNNMIPKNIAIPLMLEREIPCWRFANCAESWQSMKSEFLGYPHGSKSSLFVNQETGQAMKTIWNAMINTGMFGTTIKI